MKTAQHFEALKYSLRQSKDGVVVAFVVQPDDVQPELLSLPVGARVMIAWSQIGDDEKPGQKTYGPGLLAASSKPDRKPFHTLPLVMQCSIRCEDKQFDYYLRERFTSVGGSVAEFVRAHLGVTSRSELGKGNHDADNRWRKLEAGFKQWLLDETYAGSVR